MQCIYLGISIWFVPVASSQVQKRKERWNNGRDEYQILLQLLNIPANSNKP